MRHADVILGGVMAVFGVAVFLYAQSFPKMQGGAPGPALFPEILGVLLVLFGAVVIVQARQKHPGADIEYSGAAIVKGALILVFIAVYVAVLMRLGFVITSTALLLALMLMFGVRVITAVISSVGVVIFCVLLFQHLLRVPLPPGLLGF